MRLAYDTASAFAHLFLARGDTAQALPRFLALPDTLCPECYVDRLTRARVLLAVRRDQDAFASLGEPLVAFLSPIEVVFALELSRSAERLGRTDISRRACAFARAAWMHGDATARARVAAYCGER